MSRSNYTLSSTSKIMAPSGTEGATVTTLASPKVLVPLRVAVLDLMRQLDMKSVFGNPGSTEIGMLHSWPEDLDYVLGLQEASVVAMADGFTRVTGMAAMVNLHSAAGVGHALGSVSTAWKNGSPLVIVAGQQTRALLPGNPFLGATDAAQFPKPYVKYSIEPARAEDVLAAIAHAHTVACTRPCGPTFVSVPGDDWNVMVAPWKAKTVSRDVGADPSLLEKFATALQEAKDPVIVIGPDVDAENAGEAAVALAEKIRCPVWASPFAARVCFPEKHVLFAGHLPAAPPAISASLIKHDFVAVIGAPVFTFHVAGECPILTSGIPIWQLTADPDAAAASKATVSIIGSLRLSLPHLSNLVSPSTIRAMPTTPIRPTLPAPQPATPIPPSYLFHAISNALPPNSIIVEEAPSHRPLIQRHLPINTWMGFHTMASGGLGWSLPASVGMALAQRSRKVAVVIGDGSFMYSCQCLWTAAQRKLPIAVFVVNNSCYAAVESIGGAMGVSGIPGTDLSGLDFVSIAKGLGCQGRKVEKHEDLEAAIKEALECNDGPMVVDVVVDRALTKLYEKT